MLSYNIWRYLKILAHKSIGEQASAATEAKALHDIQGNTIRIARLKLLYIAAKTPYHDNHTTVKYSVQDTRTPGLMRLLDFLDEARRQAKAWLKGSWQCRYSLNTC